MGKIIDEAKKSNAWEGWGEKEAEVWKQFGAEWGDKLMIGSSFKETMQHYGSKIGDFFKGQLKQFWDDESGGGEINKLISQVSSDFKKVGEIFDRLEVN